MLRGLLQALVVLDYKLTINSKSRCSAGEEKGGSVSAPPLLPIYSAAFRYSGLEVDMVADKGVDKVADIDMVVNNKKNINIDINMEIQFGE